MDKDEKIKFYVLNKGICNESVFVELFMRQQSENNTIQLDDVYDEYDICTLISNLALAHPFALDKLEYIMKRTFELWKHVVKMRESDLEKIQSQVKIEKIALQ